ncbi:MAG: hypothetical protein JWN60_889 [Acidobacteria bacterium]|nr:hypothetical protein [Acidobacteriota bacterium]
MSLEFDFENSASCFSTFTATVFGKSVFSG